MKRVICQIYKDDADANLFYGRTKVGNIRGNKPDIVNVNMRKLDMRPSSPWRVTDWGWQCSVRSK